MQSIAGFSDHHPPLAVDRSLATDWVVRKDITTITPLYHTCTRKIATKNMVPLANPSLPPPH